MSETENTIYRLSKVEECCKENADILDTVKFIVDYKDELKELNIMRKDLNSIKKTNIYIIGGLVLAICTQLAFKILGI